MINIPNENFEVDQQQILDRRRRNFAIICSIAIFAVFIVSSTLEEQPYNTRPSLYYYTNETYSSYLKHLSNDMENSTLIEKVDAVFNILTSVEEQIFQGNWEMDRQIQERNFQFFHSQSGKIKIQFAQFTSESENKQYYKGNFLVYDGLYSDEYSSFGSFLLNDTKISKIEKNSVTYENVSSIFMVYDQFSIELEKQCQLDIRLKFFQEKIQNSSGSYDVPVISFSMRSTQQEDFPVFLEADMYQLDLDKQQSKIMYYSLFLTTVAVIHIISILSIMKGLIENEVMAQKYSLITLSWIFCWDGYLCILHVFSNNSIFQLYATPAFMYLLLWLVFERSMLAYIWRCQNSQIVDQQEYHRAISKFYCYLYVGVILFILMISKYAINDFFLILLNLYLLPQIIHNAYKGQQIEIQGNYLFGFGIIRSLLPILIINYQAHYGPRFFIPSFLLPRRFDYFQKLPEDIDIEAGINNEFTQECVICFNALNLEPNLQLENLQERNYQMRRLMSRKNYIMQSPCRHKFHITCLLYWMNQKMECPVCRCALPPVE